MTQAVTNSGSLLASLDPYFEQAAQLFRSEETARVRFGQDNQPLACKSKHAGIKPTTESKSSAPAPAGAA